MMCVCGQFLVVSNVGDGITTSFHGQNQVYSVTVWLSFV